MAAEELGIELWVLAPFRSDWSLLKIAMALGITDRVWSIAELIEAALKAVPTKPTPTPTQRRRQFRVIQGDLFD